MSNDTQYDSSKRCPKCGKRKVYYTIDSEGKKVEYFCTACGHSWRG